jgi:amino acid transporter
MNMDYEKPEAISPQVYQHVGHQSPQPDGEATLHGFDEPVAPEDKREFRGDSLWYGSHVKCGLVLTIIFLLTCA